MAFSEETLRSKNRNRRIWVGILLVLIIYVILKLLGVFGRQLPGKILATSSAVMYKSGQSITLDVPHNGSGKYSYNVRVIPYSGLTSEAESFLAESRISVFQTTPGNTAKVHVRLEDTRRKSTLYSHDIKYDIEPVTQGQKLIVSGDYWDIKLIDVGLFQQRKTKQIHFELESFDPTYSGRLQLRVGLVDTRPCWFVQCWLD